MRLIDAIEAWGLESRGSLPDSELQRLGTFWSSIADAPVGNRPVAFLTDRDIEDVVGLFAWTDKAELLDLVDDVREWYFARPEIPDEQPVGFSAAISAPTTAHAPVDASVALAADELGPSWSDTVGEPPPQRNPFATAAEPFSGPASVGESESAFAGPGPMGAPGLNGARAGTDPSLIGQDLDAAHDDVPFVPGIEALAQPELPDPVYPDEPVYVDEPVYLDEPVQSDEPVYLDEAVDEPAYQDEPTPAAEPGPLVADLIGLDQPVASDEPIMTGPGDGVFPAPWNDPLLTDPNPELEAEVPPDMDVPEELAPIDEPTVGDEASAIYSPLPEDAAPAAQPSAADGSTHDQNPPIDHRDPFDEPGDADPFAEPSAPAVSPPLDSSGRAPITAMGAPPDAALPQDTRAESAPPDSDRPDRTTPPRSRRDPVDSHTPGAEMLPGAQPVSLTVTGPQPVVSGFGTPSEEHEQLATVTPIDRTATLPPETHGSVAVDQAPTAAPVLPADWSDDTPLFAPQSGRAAPEDIPGMVAAMSSPPAAGDAHAGEDRSGDMRLFQLVALLIFALVLLGVVIAIGFDGTGESVGDEVRTGDLEIDTEGTSGTLASIGAGDSAAPEPTARPTTTPVAIAAAEPATDAVAEPTPVALETLGNRQASLRDGKLYLEGPVPSREWMDTIVAKANAVIGAQNVVNNYVIHPDAPEPTEGVIRIDDSIGFEPGSTTISDAFIPTLELGVSLLNLNPQVTMLIEGHTDNEGDPAANTTLSLSRATAVLEWLAVRGGIDPARLQARGYGSDRPIADNDTAEGRASNRRIEVKIFGLLDG